MWGGVPHDGAARLDFKKKRSPIMTDNGLTKHFQGRLNAIQSLSTIWFHPTQGHISTQYCTTCTQAAMAVGT